MDEQIVSSAAVARGVSPKRSVGLTARSAESDPQVVERSKRRTFNPEYKARSTPQTTARYAHLAPEAERDAIDKLGRALAPKAPQVAAVGA